MSKFDIVIAYRCYPKISKTPIYWSDDKLWMILWGLKSMVACLWDLKAKFFIIADWIPSGWEKIIVDVLWKNEVSYIYTDCIWNWRTFEKQMDLLLKQNDSEVIFFAEDDYLYNINDKDWFSEAIQLLKEWKSDFVSLFDHAVTYKWAFMRYKKHFILTKNRIWKTESSTCLTFMTTKKVLRQTRKIFDFYVKWCRDYPMWICLTKINTLRFFDIDWNYKLGLPLWKKPSLMQRILKNFPRQYIYVFMAWFYGWKQILFWKKYKLYVPTPSISTHLESTDIAPIINWDDIFSIISRKNDPEY